MITEELIASYLDGNTDPYDTMRVIRMMGKDPKLRELINTLHKMNVDLNMNSDFNDKAIEMEQSNYYAALTEQNTCNLKCEEYILNTFDKNPGFEALRKEATDKGWLMKEGTPLHHIGNLLESHGLNVKRDNGEDMSDLDKYLDNGHRVIVAVDGGELTGDLEKEWYEDRLVGLIPDHSVVVLSHDKDADTVTIYDPSTKNENDTYPTYQFLDAWDDSGKYMIIAKTEK